MWYNINMKEDASKILEEAMKLPPEARAALAGSLIESPDETVDEEAEAAWEVEIAQRIKDLGSERVKTISCIQARKKIFGR